MQGTLVQSYADRGSRAAWFDRRARREHLFMAGLGALLCAVVLFAVLMGALEISIAQVLAILLNQFGLDIGVEFKPAQETVLLSIRIPRVILGCLVGGTLAVSGAAIQGLFRNPLAEPGLIGTAGGAASGAVLAIVFTTSLVQGANFLVMWITPIAAFLGSLGVTWLIYLLSKSSGRVDVTMMLLAGIAFNAIAFAIMGLAMFMADDSQLRTITFWTLGSMAGGSWHSLMIAAPLMIAAIAGLPLMARSMDALSLGEAEAHHLGVNVERVRTWTIVLVALAVGAATAITGIVSFIGLVAPHMLRLLIGPGHRILLPGCAILGATLVVTADLISRVIAQPAELPLGVVTALLGGPYFIWLLMQSSTRRSLTG